MTEEHIVENRPPRIPDWTRKVVPIFVSALIIYYYFHDQNWAAIADAYSRMSVLVAILAIGVPQALFWFFEVWIVDRHFLWFHKPFPWRTYLWARGALYILMFVNSALGGGGIMLYLQRKSGITWKKFGGIILFRFGLSMFGFAVLMVPLTLLMCRYVDMDKVKINMYAWWGFIIFGIVYMINSWMTWHHGTNFGISKYAVRDRESEFWTAFRTASKAQWFYTWGMTLPPFIFMLIGFWFVTVDFGVKVPFVEFMVVAPLAMAVMDLPIAFAGFGTATVAWTLFFGRYGTPDQIAALTLFLPFGRALCRSLIGVVSLPFALGEINALLSPHGNEEGAKLISAEDGKDCAP